MSYSFSFRSVNKIAATTDAETKFNEILVHQPIHEKDKTQALANVNQALTLMPDDQAVQVSMNGWISTSDGNVTSVSIACQVGIAVPLPA